MATVIIKFSFMFFLKRSVESIQFIYQQDTVTNAAAGGAVSLTDSRGHIQPSSHWHFGQLT